jgi:group I intron endonuclease
MNKVCGIYKITSPSGRIYVGQSIDVERRVKKYYQRLPKQQIKLYASFMKYGVDNHIFETLETCERSDLITREMYYISLFDSCNNGLNCTIGGEGFLSKELHPCYGKPISEEHKKRISEANKGKKHTEETKLLISNKNKGKNRTDITKKKMGKSQKGRKHTEESKIKMSISQKGLKKGRPTPHTTGSNNNHAKKVICTETNKIWECVKDCWKENLLDILKYNTFTTMLSGKVKNKTKYKYYE